MNKRLSALHDRIDDTQKSLLCNALLKKISTKYIQNIPEFDETNFTKNLPDLKIKLNPIIPAYGLYNPISNIMTLKNENLHVQIHEGLHFSSRNADTLMCGFTPTPCSKNDPYGLDEIMTHLLSLKATKRQPQDFFTPSTFYAHVLDKYIYNGDLTRGYFKNENILPRNLTKNFNKLYEADTADAKSPYIAPTAEIQNQILDLFENKPHPTKAKLKTEIGEIKNIFIRAENFSGTGATFKNNRIEYIEKSAK
jgi:hypothetical protein